MWDAHHEYNMLWRAGITTMLAKSMAGVAQGQEGREKDREITAKTDGGGLEASQHGDTMQEQGPEER